MEDVSCGDDSSKKISVSEYKDLKYKESLYDELFELADVEVPKILAKIVEEELKKFNKVKKEKGDTVSWSEKISYKIYCHGFNLDDYYFSEVGYYDFVKICEERINNLSVFDRFAIDVYNHKDDEYRKNRAFEEAFCAVVEPLYFNLSEKKQDSISGMFDGCEWD